MGKLWMPVSNFKKIHEDAQSATLRHPDGHEVKLAKNILSPHMAQQLAALPIHGQQQKARGGRIKMDDGGQPLQRVADPNDPAVQKMFHDQTILAEQQKLADQAQGQGAGATAQSQPPGPQNAPIPRVQQQPSPNPLSQGMPGLFGGKSAMQLMQSGMQNQQAGAQTAMQGQMAGAGMQGQAAGAAARDLQQDLSNFQNGFTAPNGRHIMGYGERIQEADALKTDILTNQINPNHFFEQGALPKVVTAIGLLGAMANSRGGGSQILNFINQQQQRDLEAQVQNRNSKTSVLNANVQMLGDMSAATNMFRAQHLAVMQALVEKAMATTNSAMAKGNYQQVLGQLQQQKADIIQKWTVQDVMSGGMPGNTSSNPAPGTGQNMPKDAMGNPMQTGVNLGGNEAYWQAQNPVKLGGGDTFKFAKGPEQAKDADSATQSWADLNDAIKDVHESTNGFKVSAMLPGSTESQKRQGAIDRLNSVVTRLAGQGKLKPQQAQALQAMTAHLSRNPLPGFLGQNPQQAQLQGMANQNTDQLQNNYQQNLMGYQRPAKPDGEANGG